MMNIDEYIRKRYPPPKDDTFYQQWGYEQWLIKTLGKSLEQLRILLRRDYNTFRLVSEYGNTIDVVEEQIVLRNRPLVLTRRYLSTFPAPLAKGTPGVSLWENEDGTHFCIFGTRSVFGPQIGDFKKDEIIVLEQVYSGDANLPTDRMGFSYPSHMKKQYVRFNGEIWYVWDVERTLRFSPVGQKVKMLIGLAPKAKTQEYKRPRQADCVWMTIDWEQFVDILPYYF